MVHMAMLTRQCCAECPRFGAHGTTTAAPTAAERPASAMAYIDVLIITQQQTR